MALKLRMACGQYDRAEALVNGTIRPEGIDLDVHVLADESALSTRSRGGDFDIVEFYTGRYIADLPYRTLGFTAIPVFVKRMFRHSYIYVNRGKGIKSASDLNGRRVGVQTWFTTTALWARGILQEEYGVNLDSITWVAERAESIGDWKPPHWLKIEIAPARTKMYDLLASGEIDAGITTGTWAPNVHPDIDFLFPNYAELERDYFVRTGFFPIMHTVVIKTTVLEDHPWVALSMYKAWEESKQHCYAWLQRQRIHLTSLWFRALWEEERLLAGPDIYPWGFRKCQAEIEKILEYSCQQGLTPRRFKAEDMFYPTTLDT